LDERFFEMPEPMNSLYPRFVTAIVATAMKDTPVVMITGPRQCGKTTLIRDLVAGNREFLTLDDDTVLASARSDPAGLIRGLHKSALDEVQRAPDLLRSIKRSVDQDRRPGRFLLTDQPISSPFPASRRAWLDAWRSSACFLSPWQRSQATGRRF